MQRPQRPPFHRLRCTDSLETLMCCGSPLQRINGVVWRESLPRNPNGKVLKRELRQEYSSLNGNPAEAL